MTKKEQIRINNLLPNQKPKPNKVRIYDNGGKTADRYTVVFAGNYNNIGKKSRTRIQEEHPVVAMSDNPFHPLGICLYDSYPNMIDRPTYSHLGKKIKFKALPEDCQKVVVRDYCELWNLISS